MSLALLRWVLGGLLFLSVLNIRLWFCNGWGWDKSFWCNIRCHCSHFIMGSVYYIASVFMMLHSKACWKRSERFTVQKASSALRGLSGLPESNISKNWEETQPLGFFEGLSELITSECCGCMCWLIFRYSLCCRKAVIFLECIDFEILKYFISNCFLRNILLC